VAIMENQITSLCWRLVRIMCSSIW